MSLSATYQASPAPPRPMPFLLDDVRVVAGGDARRAQLDRMIEEGLELDLGVAQHVRIGRAAGLVLAQELRKHAVLVLGGEIPRLELYADHVGGGSRIEQ